MAKILLADDSIHAQGMGAKTLTAEGHEVVTVSNGQAAVKKLSSFAPDLIVADVFMPGKNGYELCQIVKSDPQRSYIPVLLIVGQMEPYDPAEGKRVHADGLVTKPLESSDLVPLVQRLLASVQKPAPPAPQPAPPPPVEEPSAEEAAAEELFTASITSKAAAHVEFEMPAEIGEQPTSAYGDLLETPSAAETEAALAVEPPTVEFPALAATPSEEPGEGALELSLAAPGLAEMEIEQPSAAGEGLLGAEPFGSFASQEMESPGLLELLTPPITIPEPEPAPQAQWRAEPVEVTEEDKKLFETPSSGWEGLTKLVQEEEGEGQFARLPMLGVEQSQAPESSIATESLPPFVPPVEAESPPQENAVQQPVVLAPEVALEVAREEATPPVSIEETADVPAEPALPPESLEMAMPTVGPLDRAAIEQMVRETMEEMLPEIVNRIVRASGVTLPKEAQEE